ncbi:MAG: hypothetical protein WBV77_14980 [Solirubrobacteraceae bacterium]
MFRLPVTSRDGTQYAVTLQVDTHRKNPSKAALNDLADRLRLSRAQVDTVLADWTSAQLLDHLGSLTIEELRSRAPIP